MLLVKMALVVLFSDKCWHLLNFCQHTLGVGVHLLPQFLWGAQTSASETSAACSLSVALAECYKTGQMV